MARRSKYTPEALKKILDAIKLGATYELAASYAGIAYETFRDWMNTKPAFSAAVHEAEGVGSIVWLAKIEQAATDGDWRAASWKLERRYPNDYGRTVTEQQHSGEVRVTLHYDNDWRRTDDH